MMFSISSSIWTASIVLFLSFCSFSTAQTNANTLIGASTKCGQQCQFLAAAGFAYETQAHASADPSFYNIPENFSASLEPGRLLRVEDATYMSNYTFPSGLTTSPLSILRPT